MSDFGPDYGRAKVYEGEFRLRTILEHANHPDSDHCVEIVGSTLAMPVERKFASIDSIQHYVDRVLALTTVKTTWPKATVPVKVIAGHKNQKHAVYCACTIKVPTTDRWAMRELVVLHEIAHHISNGTGHGPSFRHAFVDLLRTVMAPEVAFVLQVCWAEEGVDNCI